MVQGWPPWSLLKEGGWGVSRDPFLCTGSPESPDSSPHPPLTSSSGLPVILPDPLWKTYMNKHMIRGGLFHFLDQKAPFSPLTKEETKRYWDNTGKKIVPVMDFIRSTKLTVSIKFTFWCVACMAAEVCASVNDVRFLVGNSFCTCSPCVQKCSVNCIRDTVQMGFRYF